MKKTVSLLLALCMLLCVAFSASAEQPKQKTGFAQSVSEFAANIRIGWNLGNALDSVDTTNYFVSGVTPAQMEQYWGNPITTKAMLQTVKDAGFNAVRIPVSWSAFTGAAPDYTIDPAWMDRVQEVVDYAMSLDLYTIINIHHDGLIQNSTGWLYSTPAEKNDTLRQFSKVWTQIAARFQDYPEQLIFESMNEVYLPDASIPSVGTSESRHVINELNQAFVDVVRASGGNNPLRYLMCPTHGASPEESVFPEFVLPKDDRLMLSLHVYYNTWDQWNTMKAFEKKLIQWKATYIDNGIPVIIGEWGSTTQQTDAKRLEHAQIYMALATQYGVRCFWWDDGGDYRLLNRKSLTWSQPNIVSALMDAVAQSYEDPFETVLKWSADLDSYWSAKATRTYYDDGSMTILWAGKGHNAAQQNQYASRFDAFNNSIANAAIRKAQREGRTLEFSVKLLGGTNQSGTNLSQAQVIPNASFSNGTSVWINRGVEKTVTIDVSGYDKTLAYSDVIQLLVQNYSGVSAIYDVEIWISPIRLSPL